jgi:UDPglucose--hexose-1-phosphate uridylyltransferase
MINRLVNQIVQYAYDHRLLNSLDHEYAVNGVLYLLKLENYVPEVVDSPVDFFATMEGILAYAREKGILKTDSEAEKDNFEAKVMDCFLMRPSEINRHFQQLYREEPVLATKWFYDLSQATNYIKTERIKKNLTYKYLGKYAPLDITINLSKPEKDPKAIASAKKKADTAEYPACALCMENVGFYGTPDKAPRSNHRVVTLTLNGEVDSWGFQYSPYSYFNEHCIVLSKAHDPMRVDENTFLELIDFINQFPHYLIGSNAGLPIVGGSILSHYHFQGGRYDFPIEKSRILKNWRKRHVDIEILLWPVSSIRLIGSDPRMILEMVNRLFESWKEYTNESLGIFAKTDGEPHNTITPIVKFVDGEYHFYVVLRNNLATPERPYGVFHPRSEYFHIKKENIGLIEVMGLAVLPGRLKAELDLIKKCLLEGADPHVAPELEKHLPWIEELKQRSFDPATIDSDLEKEVGAIFERVLEDCGVFKDDQLLEFVRFVESALR